MSYNFVPTKTDTLAAIKKKYFKQRRQCRQNRPVGSVAKATVWQGKFYKFVSSKAPECRNLRAHNLTNYCKCPDKSLVDHRTHEYPGTWYIPCRGLFLWPAAMGSCSGTSSRCCELCAQPIMCDSTYPFSGCSPWPTNWLPSSTINCYLVIHSKQTKKST